MQAEGDVVRFPREAVAPPDFTAFFAIATNSFSRQSAMPANFVGISVSRPRK